MNCFSHACRFLDRDPYFVAGTVLPDWLTLVDRQTRVRTRNAAPFFESDNRELAELALGIARHHVDDAWFHENPLFVEMNMRFGLELRELLDADAGFRPHLVGHIVIEMLLDAWLASRDRSALDRFYTLIADVDPVLLESWVNRMAARPAFRLAEFVPRFVSERYLYDYFEDDRVAYRMNRVLDRVGLARLSDEFVDWVAVARVRVYRNAPRLLAEPVHVGDNR